MQQRWLDITMDMAMVAVSIAIAIKCVMIRTRLTMNDNEPVRKEYIDYVILDDDMQEAESVEVDTKMPVVRSAKTEVVTLRPDVELMYEGMKVSYTSPRVDLLKRVTQVKINQHEVEKNNEVIKDKLAEYGIMVTLGIAVVGPSVTMYKVAPSAGVKVKQIEALNTDLALALRCNAVRIVPVQNDNKIGIEVPNRTIAVVTAREAFEASEFRHCNYALPVVIGKAIDGSMKVVDLATMPHLLIAGATGTGKSVAINMLIVSLLYKKEPDNLRFVMIDPKKVELSIFEGIREQFLLNLTGDEKAIITDTSKAAFVLSELCNIMDSRYSQLEAAKVRNIGEYNAKKPKDQLFFIVVVIDELADLMMTR
jgi:S-DNA-T family DNA segregation ATPase FtsK/SpoIIIE